LGAALYTARARFRTLVLERMIPGGQIYNTDRIENYPGIIRIDGPSLIDQMQKQAETFGAELKITCEVDRLEKLADGNLAVHCGSERFVARAVILAMGSHYRHGSPARTSSQRYAASATAARAMPCSSGTGK
jgi:thioredoxin reductase (NADPH)